MNLSPACLKPTYTPKASCVVPFRFLSQVATTDEMATHTWNALFEAICGVESVEGRPARVQARVCGVRAVHRLIHEGHVKQPDRVPPDAVKARIASEMAAAIRRMATTGWQIFELVPRSPVRGWNEKEHGRAQVQQHMSKRQKIPYRFVV